MGLEGEGIILMQSRGGETRHLKMTPNMAVYIAPAFALQTVNVGASKLVFLSIYPSYAGHDYESIPETGFAKVVLERGEARWSLITRVTASVHEVTEIKIEELVVYAI